MKDLTIQATSSTPEIEFKSSGIMTIKGKSLPENPKQFYDPLFDWVEGFEAENVKIDIKLEYVNTSSSKNIVELIKVVDRNYKIKRFDINWYYEIDDMDMLEFGEMIGRSVKRAKTNFIECEDLND